MTYLETQQNTQDIRYFGQFGSLAHNAHFRSDLERIAQVMYTQNLALSQINRTLSTSYEPFNLIILESNRDLKAAWQ